MARRDDPFDGPLPPDPAAPVPPEPAVGEPVDPMYGDVRPDRRPDQDAPEVPVLVHGTAELTRRWDQAQAAFVDDPRSAVRQAGELVQDVLGQLERTFDDERGRLEQAWAAGGEPSTEELRQALQRYREFFDRLLAA